MFQAANRPWHRPGSGMVGLYCCTRLSSYRRRARCSPGWHFARNGVLSVLAKCRNEAYFGPDAAGWDASSIVDRIDAAPFPLMIALQGGHKTGPRIIGGI